MFPNGSSVDEYEDPVRHGGARRTRGGDVRDVPPPLLRRLSLARAFWFPYVRVFDGERVHEDTQVAVEGGVIRAVGRDLTMWRHLSVIDGTGATLMPGLIEAHAHVRSIEDLEEALRLGVTTVLDMAASGVTPRELSTIRNTAASRMDARRSSISGLSSARSRRTRYRVLYRNRRRSPHGSDRRDR